jgi:Ca2+-binding EF-hand superfamily protein
MSFDDLIKYFSSLNVAFIRYPGLNKRPWKENRKRFSFDFDRVTADQLESIPDENMIVDEFRILCPMYVLSLQERGVVVLSIHQQDLRCSEAMPYIDIGITILKTDPIYGTFQLVTGSGNSADRQNATDDVELDPGKYLVIPTTSGCKLRQYMESYGLLAGANVPLNSGNNGEKTATRKPSLNIHTGNNPNPHANKPVTRIPLTKPGSGGGSNQSSTTGGGKYEFTEDVYRVYTELFTRMDNDMDGYLNKDEIDQYMLRTEGSSIEHIAYQWLLHNFENRDSPGLSLAGFLRAQLYIFNKTNGDEEKLWNEFKLLGYDDHLQLRSCRSAVLAVHSTIDFQLDTVPYDENAYQDAQELVIIAKGEVTSYEDGKIKVYKYHSGFSGISLLVENKHHLPLVMLIDCSESENLYSHRGNLIHKDIILPNKRVIMHHLSPGDAELKIWTLAYSASYMWDE